MYSIAFLFLHIFYGQKYYLRIIPLAENSMDCIFIADQGGLIFQSHYYQHLSSSKGKTFLTQFSKQRDDAQGYGD
jgi:hypothetical protein